MEVEYWAVLIVVIVVVVGYVLIKWIETFIYKELESKVEELEEIYRIEYEIGQPILSGGNKWYPVNKKQNVYRGGLDCFWGTNWEVVVEYFKVKDEARLYIDAIQKD